MLKGTQCTNGIGAEYRINWHGMGLIYERKREREREGGREEREKTSM